ncbi:MAG: nitroreductase family protein [Desulfobacterales bacterium]|nr:MAG: nitroreductase family protein [Desulfobacterales bacterium]
MIENLIRQNRSCRRFYEDHSVNLETLRELIDLGRLSASGGNLQPLKYILCCRRTKNAEIFACLGWAAYLKDWPGPTEGERPAAYIIVLGDTQIASEFDRDVGIASQSIMLGARAKGLGGCMLGAINRKKLRENLHLPPRVRILLVLALGKPKEEIVLETVAPDGNIRYWRDKAGVHHVPNRPLDDIILASYAS